MPLWKLKRELRRIVRQIAGFPKVAFLYYFSTPYYDFVLARNRIVIDGRAAYTDRVAIFVIYPTSGFITSHARTIEHLAKKGYATIVVSNVSLDHASRATLLDRCWKYIERPNFGYDFGGYRDGIMLVAHDLHRLRRLILLNDSCWFPLPKSADWIEKAEALDVDYAGAATHYGVRTPDADKYTEIVWDYAPDRPDFHICSFALSLSNSIIGDKRFLSFWRHFRLSNDKARTVRRGEIGLTQWVRRKGFSHASVYDVVSLEEELHTMADSDLRALLVSLIIPHDSSLKDVSAAIMCNIKANSVTRTDMEKFVLTVVGRTGMSYALAAHLIVEKGYPFLKKSPVWLDEDASDKTMEILARLGDDASDIREEAMAIRTKSKFPVSGGVHRCQFR